MSISNVGAYSVGSMSGMELANAINTGKVSKQEVPQSELKSLMSTGAVQCSTCAQRKYQDGSDEGDVSFKAATHIDPSNSAAAVMSHELEHVSNAYEDAAKKGGKVIRATVTIQHAICPECGRSYVSGGLTNKAISYKDDTYSQNQKSLDYQSLTGANIDYRVG